MTTPGTYRPSLTDGRKFGIDISLSPAAQASAQDQF